MSWASDFITRLKSGKEVEVKFRPTGNSMVPIIRSGQLCTLQPISDDPRVGDVVLCQVNGSDYLHLIKAIKNGQYQIGNNRGGINGWTSLDRIYGKLVSVEE